MGNIYSQLFLTPRVSPVSVVQVPVMSGGSLGVGKCLVVLFSACAVQTPLASYTEHTVPYSGRPCGRMG